MFVATPAGAGGGTSFSVDTTAYVAGTVISGVITVTNEESEATTFTAISSSLEVRFDDGTTPPPLPDGSDSDWYKVAEVFLAAPVSLPAGGSQSFPFAIDTCGSGVANYSGAEDMRGYSSVTAGRIRDAHTDSFPVPPPCPVCGNYEVEAGEQCDEGSSGGQCCTAACESRSNGTACSDGNACSQIDECQAGICVSGDPVLCAAADQCHDAGTCDPGTGACSNPVKANGSLCSDQDACTQDDACQSGACLAGSPVSCVASGTCFDAACDPATGGCFELPRADGATCSDGNACTPTDLCQAGVCTAGDPISCTASDQCHDTGVCDPTTGVCSDPLRANDSPCSDGDACTQSDTCQAGNCVGANPVSCTASGDCLDASCDPTTGDCVDASKPDGTACLDADACTSGDSCLGGECISGGPLECNDHLSCTDDVCDAATGCGFSSAPVCEACDAAECTTCGEICDADYDECSTTCWSNFMGCLSGCTSTYCAPFCQVDLGRCLDRCPATDSCRSECEVGNGCAEGCAGVAATVGAPVAVPAIAGWGFVALTALVASAGTYLLRRRGSSVAQRR